MALEQEIQCGRDLLLLLGQRSGRLPCLQLPQICGPIYAARYLAAFTYRFSRRFDLRTLHARRVVAAATCAPQHRLIRGSLRGIASAKKTTTHSPQDARHDNAHGVDDRQGRHGVTPFVHVLCPAEIRRPRTVCFVEREIRRSDGQQDECDRHATRQSAQLPSSHFGASGYLTVR